MKLKEGQVYKRIEGPNEVFTVGHYYPVRINEYGVPFILSDSDAPWYSGDIIYERFELVEEPTPDPTSDVKSVFINVENLMEHIVTNKLEVNEILSYLDGYVEGSRF